MDVTEIIEELKANGSESIKKVLLKHGAKEPFFGVKIEYLKKIQKRIKTDYQLALDLYATGISDAMYLAGLIADDAKMTKKDLQRWVDGANWSLHTGSTVPWVAAGSPHGNDMALKWIDSKSSWIAATGWATLSNLVALKLDDELDLKAIEKLLDRVQRTINDQRDGARYAMNGFVIAIGVYVAPLSDRALAAAQKIGAVSVDMGETACKVPAAVEAIKKAVGKGVVGKKKKTVKC